MNDQRCIVIVTKQGGVFCFVLRNAVYKNPHGARIAIGRAQSWDRKGGYYYEYRIVGVDCRGEL